MKRIYPIYTSYSCNSIMKIMRFFALPMIIVLSVWIMVNPYVSTQDSGFITHCTGLVNEFCSNFNLSYKFTSNDVLCLFRFLEYFLLGALSVYCCRLYLKNFWKNVTIPLFLGLSFILFDAYFRSGFSEYVRLQDIIYPFLNFCIGTLLFSANIKQLIFRKNNLKKNKTGRYIGRS